MIQREENTSGVRGKEAGVKRRKIDGMKKEMEENSEETICTLNTMHTGNRINQRSHTVYVHGGLGVCRFSSYHLISQ